MDSRQQKVLQRFGQVLTFLDENRSTIPPNAVAAQRQTLQTAVTQITTFAQDQVVKGHESVVAQTKTSARVALRDTFMRQLSAVGLHHLRGKHAGDPDVPNAKLTFTLPTSHDALTVLNSAKSMVAMATQYASIFTANGVNLDAVNAAIQALESAVNAADAAKRVSKGATEGIKAQIAAGHGAVALMDVVVRPLVAANKSLASQWKAVKKAAGGHNLATPVPVPGAIPAPTAQPTQGTAGSTTVGTTSPATPSTPAPATATGGTPQQPATTQSPATQAPTTQPAGSTPAKAGV